MLGPIDPSLTQLVEQASRGNREAAAALLPLVYHELRCLARRALRECPTAALEPTELVHEAYLRLIGPATAQEMTRTHFFAQAARTVRHVLVDHARSRDALKRGRGWERVTLSSQIDFVGNAAVDLLALHEALENLAALHDRQAQVVELHVFTGLTLQEISHVLGVSLTTVQGWWRFARAFLRRALDSGSRL
ncbi:MAG: ECF-type sigma factor [Planctomycetota bacterium]